MATTYKDGLGEAIRAKCDRLGTTMSQASMDLGLPPNAMSRWNTGVLPTPIHYQVLMDFLGVSLDQLGALIVRQQAKRVGLTDLL